MNNLNSLVINVLTEKQTIKSLTTHVLALAEQVELLQTQLIASKLDAQATRIAPQATRKPTTNGRKPRDYGPSSTRKATRLDAWEIIFGDHSSHKARQIADELGLSRGQVYSIQGGYTFRDVAFDEFVSDTHVDGFVGPLAA